jgi:hypothetical protein
MPNPASALGEAVGKSVEREVQTIIQECVAPFGLYVDVGGKRKGRRGQKLLLVNETGNEYQIDTVVENKDGKPLILVESKYLRYKKHNRDKASWTCVAHFKLRTTYPSVKKSIAILLGNWSKPSQELMKSFGIELILVPFKRMVRVLRHHKIDFDWPEKDSETPKVGWKTYNELDDVQRRDIARKCLSNEREKIRRMILDAVRADPEKPKNIDKIELLLRTSHNEYYVKKFPHIKDTIQYLISLIEDARDLRGLLK